MFVLCYWSFCLPTSLGIVNIGVNNVQELIVAADMLQLTEVVNLCCEFLKGQIDPLNCIGIFQFSEQIACHDLLEFTENYSLRKTESVLWRFFSLLRNLRLGYIK